VDPCLSDPRLRLYRFVFEHARDATVVFDADGRSILLNLAARELPAELLERFFDVDAPHAAGLATFRRDVLDQGHARGRIRAGERVLVVDGRQHGGQLVVTLHDAWD
jgi:PAS domain-containing protein